MQIIEAIGNWELMDREKTLFICSKHTPINLYEYIFNWTESLNEKDCIACFNSTSMEKEVLKALLVANIPTVLYVMNRFTDVNNLQIEKALQEGRLLIVVLRRDEPRGKGPTPRLRNEYVLSVCEHVVCGYVNKNGSVFSLLANRKNVVRIIDDSLGSVAAESKKNRERWTVAQDKVLLRMYYADMGIHAIHKKLKRSYSAVYLRIQSITQPEEMLKGREFEDYVLSMFNIDKTEGLALLEWQGDKSLGNIFPENNCNPDFVLRYKKKPFAVECKWREKLSSSANKELFTKKSIENYTDFSKNRNMPVTIVLGVGGEPCDPETLYLIPLEKIPEGPLQKDFLAGFIVSGEALDVSSFLRSKKKEKKRSRAEALGFEEIRKVFPNAYMPWSDEDDEKLTLLVKEGKTTKEIAAIFGRQNSAILSRIRKLELK